MYVEFKFRGLIWEQNFNTLKLSPKDESERVVNQRHEEKFGWFTELYIERFGKKF